MLAGKCVWLCGPYPAKTIDCPSLDVKVRPQIRYPLCPAKQCSVFDGRNLLSWKRTMDKLHGCQWFMPFCLGAHGTVDIVSPAGVNRHLHMDNATCVDPDAMDHWLRLKETSGRSPGKRCQLRRLWFWDTNALASLALLKGIGQFPLNAGEQPTLTFIVMLHTRHYPKWHNQQLFIMVHTRDYPKWPKSANWCCLANLWACDIG